MKIKLPLGVALVIHYSFSCLVVGTIFFHVGTIFWRWLSGVWSDELNSASTAPSTTSASRTSRSTSSTSSPSSTQRREPHPSQRLKPYKEKGKVFDKYRQDNHIVHLAIASHFAHQRHDQLLCCYSDVGSSSCQPQRLDFSTNVLDSRDLFYLHQLGNY
jgi:hypothetical protein